MIDPATETIISLAEATEMVPGKKPGTRIHLSAIYRAVWPGHNGVCLETIVLCGRSFTSREAMDRFFKASTEAKQRKREERAAVRQGRRPARTPEQQVAADKASADVEAMLAPAARGR
jgi:Protein of unknown function (DUF1580)